MQNSKAKEAVKLSSKEGWGDKQVKEAKDAVRQSS